jgi:hypothetical protein
MATQATFSGPIPEEGVREVLGGLEEIGTTGVLAFRSTAGSGTIKLVQGQIEARGISEEQERALEVLLSLRDGEFAVYPKLPHLPVSRGTDTTRRGSLAVHPPSELMRYCENSGLTGRLLLEHRGRLAIAYYEKGELEDVSIDGGTPADFVTALEWTEGTFRVDAVPPPRETLPPSLRAVTPEVPSSSSSSRPVKKDSPSWNAPTTRRFLGSVRASKRKTKMRRFASFGAPEAQRQPLRPRAGTHSTILLPFRRNLLQLIP